LRASWDALIDRRRRGILAPVVDDNIEAGAEAPQPSPAPDLAGSGDQLWFNISQCKILKGCIKRFETTFRREVVDIIREQMRGFEPPEVLEILQELRVIDNQLGRGLQPSNVHPIHAKLLRHVILTQRRELASATDGPRQKTAHKGAIRHLERETRVLEAMMEREWFADVGNTRVPRLTHFLSIRYAEEALEAAHRLAPREYDEKFHILEAPSLFLPDLGYYRARCALRDSGVSVVYVDVDNFKRYNSEYTETRVDRDLLPTLMETIEAHVFAHGHAYRFGGDEYVLLLPNAGPDWVLCFLRELCAKVSAAEYVGIREAPTLSIGVCHLSVECALTDMEALARANDAEGFAKARGKNTIATYRGELYRSQDLELV